MIELLSRFYLSSPKYHPLEMENHFTRRAIISMQTEFSQLAKVIRDTCLRRPVYYIGNKGNWGDALIRQGTLRFFRDIGLKYYELLLRKGRVFRLIDRYLPLALKGTLIYGGGGSWCHVYDNSLRLLNSIASSYRQVIVLPSTFEERVDFPNLTFFSRDRFESLQVVPEATFCHDMAFYIQRQTGGKGTGEGYFFRTDQESLGKIPIPSENVDISLQGNYLTPIAPFFSAIDRYRTIYTDRLHVAIAACLMKKDLHLYPGTYFKNKAVYRSSMLGIYDNVQFHDL
jgi:exopolysaccharide biosynthesis predicted pyruvyltransferase EpsI